jgi:hypothetical protein
VRGKEVKQGQSGADHNVRLHKGTVHNGRCLHLDVTPQEGMIFHCAGQASGESRVFDIWDLQGAFDQFLRQAAPLVARDPHFPQPPKNSIIFQIQNLLPESSLSPLRNRGINLPVVAQRFTTCSPNAPECAYYLPEPTTIWLGAFRSVSKSWKTKTLSDATAETFSR